MAPLGAAEPKALDDELRLDARATFGQSLISGAKSLKGESVIALPDRVKLIIYIVGSLVY
jgi:hypothetical protein